jgi:hypothetical protein
MSEVSRSNAGAAATSTGEARPVAASTGEQMEEGMSGAPMADVAWPSVATTS